MWTCSFSASVSWECWGGRREECQRTSLALLGAPTIARNLSEEKKKQRFQRDEYQSKYHCNYTYGNINLVLVLKKVNQYSLETFSLSLVVMSPTIIVVSQSTMR